MLSFALFVEQHNSKDREFGLFDQFENHLVRRESDQKSWRTIKSYPFVEHLPSQKQNSNFRWSSRANRMSKPDSCRYEGQYDWKWW